MDFIEGEILYIDKPLHWTSFRVVRVVRAKLCEKLRLKRLKVGHAGTLDPLATGVMIICTGKKTKQIEQLQATEKEYVATLKLGQTTPSFDLETPVDAEFPTEHITEKLLQQTLRQFVGKIAQVPPDFSACKINGKRAYELARKNKPVELKPKLLVIKSIELIDIDLPVFQLKVVCGKGTYIRALARDIGKALNSGAHLVALQRTRVGDGLLSKCLPISDLDDFFDKNITD